MNDMKLGQKVKCKSHIKRIPQKYVVLGYGRDIKDCSEKEITAIANEAAFLEDDTEYRQQTHDVVPRVFEGLIMGRRKKAMANYVEAIVDHPYFADHIRATRADYIDCFLVAYSMGGTRLVPVGDVEKIEG